MVITSFSSYYILSVKNVLIIKLCCAFFPRKRKKQKFFFFSFTECGRNVLNVIRTVVRMLWRCFFVSKNVLEQCFVWFKRREREIGVDHRRDKKRSVVRIEFAAKKLLFPIQIVSFPLLCCLRFWLCYILCLGGIDSYRGLTNTHYTLSIQNSTVPSSIVNSYNVPSYIIPNF